MITINGKRWRVQLVPPSHPILTQKPGNPAIGCCDDNLRTIFISNAVPQLQLKYVIRHELVHAIMYSYGIEISNETEELVADFVATYGKKVIALTNKVFNELK